MKQPQLDGVASISGCVLLQKSWLWLFLEPSNRCFKPSGAGYVAFSPWGIVNCCILHVCRYSLVRGWWGSSRKLDPWGHCAQCNGKESHSLAFTFRVRGIQTISKAVEYFWELQEACWCLLCLLVVLVIQAVILIWWLFVIILFLIIPRNLSKCVTK